MKKILILAAMVLVAGCDFALAEDVIAPNGVWLDAWPKVLSGPGWATVDATREEAEAAGYHAPTQSEIDAKAAQDAADAQAEAGASAARLGALAQGYGPIVARLQANMVLCGYSIPVEPQTVMAGLLAKDAMGTITEGEERAMSKVFMIHAALLGDGLTNADIAAIWEAIKNE